MILDERLRWMGFWMLDKMTRFVMPGKKAALLRRQRRESRI